MEGIKMGYSEQIRAVFDKEIEALRTAKDNIGDSLDAVIETLYQCKGKVIFSGVGKSGNIGAKLASTFSSLGTPSFFMHPVEARHGDLGMLDQNDVVILLSYSGESREVIDLLPYIQSKGITSICITGNSASTLSKGCDITYSFPAMEEASRFGLAPTSSTTTLLVFGDALAVVLSELKGFRREDFIALHPGGVLGEVS